MLRQELSLTKVFNGHQENTSLSLSLSSIFLLLTIGSKITCNIFNRVKDIAINKTKKDIIDDEKWASKQDKN